MERRAVEAEAEAGDPGGPGRLGRWIDGPWLRARAELRRRWRSLLVVSLVAGLAGGFAVTMLAGGRRTASAWERFRTVTLANDAFVAVPSRPDPGFADELAAMPGVLAATSFSFVAVTLPGVPEGGAFAAGDDRFLRTVERGHLLEGRRFDPERADEVVVNPAMADAAGVRAGARVWLQGVGDSSFSTPVTVVGVVREANDVALNTGSPGLLLTPAFLAEHGDQVEASRTNQFVRLEGGRAGFAAFRDRLIARFGRDSGVVVGDSAAEASGVRDALRLQATSLTLLALAAGAAVVLAVGQALARHLADAAAEAEVLRALGMTTGERTVAGLGPVLLVAAGSGVLSVAVAGAASGLSTTGLARDVETKTGVILDATTALGGVALFALLGAWGLVAARRAAHLRPREARVRVGPGGRVPLSAPARLGLATAIGQGSPRTRVAARSATLAGLVGVAGITAAVTFAASLDHLLDTPRLYGFNADAVAGSGGDEGSRVDSAVAGLARDDDVERITTYDLQFMTLGEDAVETFLVEPRKGAPILPTLEAGREARSPGEVVLGAGTMADLGVGLGDRVEAVGVDGPVPLVVVGRGIFPVLGDGSTTRAAALPAGAAAGLRLEESRTRIVMVGVRPGADAVAVVQRHTDLPVAGAEPPAQVKNLELVRAAPWWLAAFLGLLAAAALAHALVVCVRAGRRELAVLRALGFLRRQVQATIRWQASAIMAMALVTGLPLGFIVGRWTWQLTAQGTGALMEPAVAAAVLAAIVPVGLLLANLAAAGPARAAGAMRPTEVLRAE